MRIRIEFTEEERKAFMEATDTTYDVALEKAKGDFGEWEYNGKNRTIEMDFKEGFIVSYALLIGTGISMVKSWLHACNLFKSSWLSKGTKKEVVEKEE